MSKKPNPSVIGLFVVLAVMVIATGVVVFGGTELLAKKNVYVAYFRDRVKGLRVGANVLMQGVRIGYVSDIELRADVATSKVITQVTMEILPEKFTLMRNGKLISSDLRSSLNHKQLVEQAGLRAQLSIDSFVTNQLLVELDFRPDTIAVMRGDKAPYPEIPTIRSDIQEAVDNLQTWLADFQGAIDFKKLGHHLENVLRGMDELVNSPDIRDSIAAVHHIISAAESQQLPSEMRQSLAEIKAAFAETRRVIERTGSHLDALFEDLHPVITELKPVMSDLRPTLSQLTLTLAEAQTALRSASHQLEGDTEQVYQLQSALSELESAARSMRAFFDYLERNPETLLRGKHRPKDSSQ